MRIIPGNEQWRSEGWVMQINGTTQAAEYVNAFFSPFSRGGHRLSSEGDKALKLCTLHAIPPPPPGIVAEDVSLPPHLEAVAPEQLSEVVLGLAEAALFLPPALRPHRRVVVEELLPELERLTGIAKCNWCLHPSNRCPCGGVPSQAPRRAPTTPEDRPPFISAGDLNSPPKGSSYETTCRCTPWWQSVPWDPGLPHSHHGKPTGGASAYVDTPIGGTGHEAHYRAFFS